MEKSKKKVLFTLLSVVIVLLSLTFCIVDAVSSIDVWTHPVLNFLFGLFIGFGALSYFQAFSTKSTMYAFFGTLLVSLAILYGTIQYLPWWGALICAIAFAICLTIISYAVFGNKLEQADNSSPDYKNYIERREEEKKQEQEEKIELPEIKSFK